MSEGLKKDLIIMKQQLDSNITLYDKKFEEMLVERKGLLEENEQLSDKIGKLNADQETLENNFDSISGGFNQSLDEITQLEQAQRAEIERAEVKLRLLEETLNKRNEKQSVLVKEYQQLTKNIEQNEKSRAECERRIVENGEKLKKRLEDLNKSNNINQKDTIEMLYEKINQLSNLLAVSEEKNMR